jgi:hypothetical protein
MPWVPHASLPLRRVGLGICSAALNVLPYNPGRTHKDLPVVIERKLLSVFAYFRSPFPSTQGFSAYRMPGMAVHGPLIVATVLVGSLLCWPHAVLRPLMIIWVLAGLYLGRDIAVLCHYNGLLTLVCWGVAALVFIKPAPIARFGASHIVIPSVLSAALGIVLFLVAFAMSRQAGKDYAVKPQR